MLDSCFDYTLTSCCLLTVEKPFDVRGKLLQQVRSGVRGDKNVTLPYAIFQGLVGLGRQHIGGQHPCPVTTYEITGIESQPSIMGAGNEGAAEGVPKAKRHLCILRWIIADVIA